MNRFKLKRQTVACVSCRQVHLARTVIAARPLTEDIITIGFQCTACKRWNRLYYETPEIRDERNRLAAQSLTASQPHLLNLRKAFTVLFTSEQVRVKKLLAEGKLNPVASSFAPEGVTV